VLIILQKFEISPLKIGYFGLDNASNKDSTIQAIAHKLEWNFNATYCRLRCGPHTLNLIGQVLHWGKKPEAYDNNYALSDIAETQLIKSGDAMAY